MGKAILDIVGLFFIGLVVFFCTAALIAFIWAFDIDYELKLCLSIPLALLAFTGYQLFALRVMLMITERTDTLYDIAERIDTLLKIQYTVAIEQSESPETRSLLKELASNFDETEQEKS